MATSYPSKFSAVPYLGIRWVVDRMHVGTAPHHVRAEMERRMASLAPADLREAVRYALAVHADNGKLYRAVTSGRLTRVAS